MRDIERKFNEKLKEWLRRDEQKVNIICFFNIDLK